MRVIILAAQLDPSLYPATMKKPKALVEIDGKPLLDHIIENVFTIKPDSISIITNDLHHEEFIVWREHRKKFSSVSFFNNGADLDYPGHGVVADLYDLVRSSRISDSSYLVISADYYFDYPLNHFVLQALHHMPKPVLTCYDVKSKNAVKNCSVIQIDSHHRVLDALEKQDIESTLIDMGIYLFPKGIILVLYEYLKMQRRNPHKLEDFILWLARRQTVMAVLIDGYVKSGTLTTQLKGDVNVGIGNKDRTDVRN